MPVIRLQNDLADPTAHDRLVQELADELLGRDARGRAAIFEIPIKQTTTLHVIVVSDEWRQISPDERSIIILDAYAEADRETAASEPKAPRITLAMGLTWDEPLTRRTLPYAIESHARPTEVDLNEVERAMTEEGGVQTGRGMRLRFPTMGMANAAYERLVRKLPSANWAVVGTGPSIDD